MSRDRMILLLYVLKHTGRWEKQKTESTTLPKKQYDDDDRFVAEQQPETIFFNFLQNWFSLADY